MTAKKYFRRDHFAKYPDTQPLWHILASAERGHYTALCGYKFYFILEYPLTRDQVKTKKLRCTRCDAKESV